MPTMPWVPCPLSMHPQRLHRLHRLHRLQRVQLLLRSRHRPAQRNGFQRALAAALACGAAAVLLATGCAAQSTQGTGSPQAQPSAAPATPGAVQATPTAVQATPHRIHVVRHGMHSGIAVRAADVPEQAWPARRDFADAEFLEVGWGDRAYYQAPDPSLWLGLQALLWPTPGVLHMAAFSGPVQGQFQAAEIIVLQITPRGLERLIAAIADSHERDAAGRPIPLGPGLYGTSRFYASREQFHLFATCNAWTAAILRQAGVPLGPLVPPTAEALFTQLRRLGAVVRAAP